MKKKYAYRNFFISIFLIGIFVPGHVSAIAITTYTDRTAWENALSGFSIFDETFDGAASDFGANSSGNIVGDLAIDIIGHGNDSDRQGLTGTGFFAGEVDSSDIVTSDGATVRFNLPSFGFALIGLQDDSMSSPDLNVHELGVLLLGQSFLLSDVLGLTGPNDSSAPDAQVPFLGFVSDTQFTSFDLVHGYRIRSVSGSSQDFWLAGLAYSSATPVSEPSLLALFGLGLAGIALSRKKKKVNNPLA